MSLQIQKPTRFAVPDVREADTVDAEIQEKRREIKVNVTLRWVAWGLFLVVMVMFVTHRLLMLSFGRTPIAITDFSAAMALAWMAAYAVDAMSR